MVEMRRLCLERRREKGPCETEDPLHRSAQARQKMRRKQATLRCKEATQLGAPPRLHHQPELQSWNVWTNQGRLRMWNTWTDARTLCTGFSELFTDHSHAARSEWIEQRWPYEILLTLPMIDGARVREMAFEFRKRTAPRRQKSFGKHIRSPWSTGKLTMRGFRPIAMLSTTYRLYSKTPLQLSGQSRPQYGHVLGRQAHEVVRMLRSLVE